MSYYDDWHEGKLEANTVQNAYIIDGNNQVDITNYITPQNCVFNRGTTEGVYNSFSQDSLTLELNNSTHRFDAYDFKGKELHIEVYTTVDDSEDYYGTDFYHFKINKATFNDEFISLESNVINVDTSRAGWNIYGTPAVEFWAISVANVFLSALNVLFNFGTIYTTGDITTFSNSRDSLPSVYFDWDEYSKSCRDNIKTNADMILQTMQVCGGFTFLDKGYNYPFVQIQHFPKSTLNTEVSDYVYGGCFDETETTYRTGDSLDGNTDTKDGGNFTINYQIIDDDVLIDLKIGTEYYRPTGIVALVPEWTYDSESGEWSANDIEWVYGTKDRAVDLSNNEIIKIVRFMTGTTPYDTIFGDIFNEIDFSSINFEATVLNNLRFNLGEVVAISSGVMPTRFSYIENINTDLFGATIISNNRSGE